MTRAIIGARPTSAFQRTRSEELLVVRKGRWGRVAAITACLCLVTASAATAGGTRHSNARATTNLTMWYWGDQEAAGLKGFVADSVKKYEALHPEIKITTTLQSTGNLVPAFEAAAAA